MTVNGEPLPAVEIRGLDAFYGTTQAIANVSMVVQPNSVTALIGPSGCGKSTLLRTLNRMHEVVAGAQIRGTVLLDGQNIYADSVDPVDVRRTVGMVFQKPSPFLNMSIYENVAAGLRPGRRRYPKPLLDEVVERSLRAANLWTEVKDRLRAQVTSLSGGQQQRLCIARALAIQPLVLLMDEPCSALDPIATHAIEDLIFEMKKQYTIVIVTHNMQQAARVSDHTGFFTIAATGQPGRLIELGATERIFTKPADSRTSDYITGRLG